MKNQINTKRLVRTALVAAIYAALTVFLAPISYGSLQFRVSELLVLLAFYDPFYIGGLTLGCFIANLLGPNGTLDVIFGTIATFLSVGAISLTAKYMKNKASLFIASLWPTIFNGLIIGWVLNVSFGIPLLIAAGEVAIGEFVVITIVGIPVYKFIESKYSRILRTESL